MSKKSAERSEAERWDEPAVPVFDPNQLRIPLDQPNQDAMARHCGLSCPPEEDRTRQEFKEECDINSIVAHFYPFAPPTRPVQYGEQDMGMDLHSAMLSMQAAREAFAEAPEALRVKFPTFDAFLTAVMNHEIEFVPIKGEEAPAGSSGGGSAPSAGDSPPVPETK